MIDLAQCGPYRAIQNNKMEPRLAIFLMVSIALAYFVSRMLWHWNVSDPEG
jgi:hypothetical protein